jgi:hypothetical protein
MTAAFARERAYLSNARAFGRRWRDYAQLIAVTVLALVALILLPAFPFKQLALGLAVGAIAMAAVLSAARYDDWQVRGYLAETFSVEALRKVSGWSVVDNLAFEAEDVDHVVVTPSGVLAVESKHHNHAVSATTAQRDLADARRAARKIRLFLGSVGHSTVQVASVLMVWGPGQPKLAKGFRLVDDVVVVDSEHPELWSYQFAAPLLAPAQRTQVYEALARYARTRAEYKAADTPSLATRIWDEIKTGAQEERAARTARRALARRNRRRHAHGVTDPA